LRLSGILDCIVAFDVSFAPGFMRALNLGFQVRGRLTLGFFVSPACNVALLCGLAQVCQLPFSVSGNLDRIVAFGVSLAPGFMRALNLGFQVCNLHALSFAGLLHCILMGCVVTRFCRLVLA
jgi:hypothetical protein